MAHSSSDPRAAVPEADLLDQQLPQPLTAADDPDASQTSVLVADEADMHDQLTPLPVDDAEDYPHAWEWDDA